VSNENYMYVDAHLGIMQMIPCQQVECMTHLTRNSLIMVDVKENIRYHNHQEQLEDLKMETFTENLWENERNKINRNEAYVHQLLSDTKSGHVIMSSPNILSFVFLVLLFAPFLFTTKLNLFGPVDFSNLKSWKITET